MGYKLIALDIDGTIRSAEYPLSPRTRRAIGQVRANGVHVTLATGRMFESAVVSSSELNIDTPIVSYQGAQVSDPTTGEVLWQVTLTPRMTSDALDALDEWGLEVMAYHGGDVYVAESSPWIEGYIERNDVVVHSVGNLRKAAHLGFTRLVVVGDDDDIRDLEASLLRQFDSSLHVTRSLPHFCEILNPCGGKHKALGWLCARLGVRPDETIAFGNGYNDVHMLSWAGLAVAIDGAVDETLAVADKIAPPIEEDGAAQVIEELLDAGLLGP